MSIPDVIVVGAGMAGLTCARALAERGLRVTVVESQSRVGGRILTRRIGNQTIELGAEFIHGRPPELLALIAEAGCSLSERTGQQIRFEHGRLTPQSDTDHNTSFDPLERLTTYPGDDLSFIDYLDREAFDEKTRQSSIGYVEGFNAADATEISSLALALQQRAEDANDGNRVFSLREGYDRLPEYLATRLRELGVDLRLGCPVSAINWRPGEVQLTTPEGPLRASKCVITLPLGVLHARTVRFDPEPACLEAATQALRMGDVCRFTLLFGRAFWQLCEPQPEMQHLSFLFAFEETPPVWWTTHPEPAPTLTGWVGGPRSTSLLAQSDTTLARSACDTLATLFLLEPGWVWEQFLSFHRHDWTADPWSRGAYSYVAVNGLTASKTLSQPVDKTLFFAGEHTDISGHWGTVHAALRSGLRAARQILGEP